MDHRCRSTAPGLEQGRSASGRGIGIDQFHGSAREVVVLDIDDQQGGRHPVSDADAWPMAAAAVVSVGIATVGDGRTVGGPGRRSGAKRGPPLAAVMVRRCTVGVRTALAARGALVRRLSLGPRQCRVDQLPRQARCEGGDEVVDVAAEERAAADRQFGHVDGERWPASSDRNAGSRSSSNAIDGDDADTEAELDVGLDDVRVHRREDDIGLEPGSGERLVDMGPARVVGAVGDDGNSASRSSVSA